jgi:hypothetical protein
VEVTILVAFSFDLLASVSSVSLSTCPLLEEESIVEDRTTVDVFLEEATADEVLMHMTFVCDDIQDAILIQSINDV